MFCAFIAGVPSKMALRAIAMVLFILVVGLLVFGFVGGMAALGFPTKVKPCDG
jgi:hypothetical protein